MTAPRNANQERNVEERISVLGVVTPAQETELKSILSHTRWQVELVHSIAEAITAIRSLAISVILCEEKLSDGTWRDLIEATRQLCPRPEILVLSVNADMGLWAEVLNCGGYDLMARPLRAPEIYDVVPMAWRQLKVAAGRKSAAIVKAPTRALVHVAGGIH